MLLTASQAGMSELEDVKGKISAVEGKISSLEGKISSLEERLKDLDVNDQAYASLRQELVALLQELAALRQELAALRQELAALREEKTMLLRASQGLAQGTVTPGVAENTKLTDFIQALCGATEALLVEGPALLELPAGVIYPGLHPGPGCAPTLLVRECWKDFRDLILQQGKTLVIGTPGIGKSVFAWWFIGCLAALGHTIVYRKGKASKSQLWKGGRVLQGAHDAFDSLQDDTNTWWVYDAMEPDPWLIDIKAKILVMSSPSRGRYKDFQNAPRVVTMVMPPWSLDEIMLGLKYVYPTTKYPGMNAARVQNLFTYYGGVPRFVLGKPSEISGPAADRKDLDDFNNAVSECDATQVLRGAVAIEAVPEKYHRLLHLIPTSSDYTEWITKYASEQALLRVWAKAGADAASAMQAFWHSSAGNSEQTAMRGQILEEVTKTDLASSSIDYDERLLVRDFGATTPQYTPEQRQQNKQVESASRVITIKPGRRVDFKFDNTNYEQQLRDSWQRQGAWVGRTLFTPVGSTFPEVDCVMLPAPKAGQADGTAEVELVELFQITAGSNKNINRHTLAKILCALPDAKQYNLYFVVPKEQFRTFTVGPIGRSEVIKEWQERLDRVKAHVISNVKGVNALHSFVSSSSSSSKDVSSDG